MTNQDDVTEFGAFDSGGHDAPDNDDAPEEGYTMSLEESVRIVSECRAAGGSAADAWEALKAARRAAKLAARVMREAAFCSHADAGTAERPWAPCNRAATTTRVREFVPGFHVVVPVCAEHAAAGAPTSQLRKVSPRATGSR